MNLYEEKISDYAEKFSSPEHPVLKDLSRDTRAHVLKPQMLSGHLQGNFLKMLVAISGAKSILEIGTYTGYSAIAMALALPDNGKLHTIDVNDELKPMVDKYIKKAGLTDKIKTWFDDALKVIPKLNETFDLVFIDADKGNYSRYYDLVFEKVKPGGIIIADNVLWSGKVLENNGDKDTLALKAYTEKVNTDQRVEKLLLPLRDGLLIARKLSL